jgi:uracil-DNA glycosylase
MSWDERQRAMLKEMGLALPPARVAPAQAALDAAAPTSVSPAVAIPSASAAPKAPTPIAPSPAAVALPAPMAPLDWPQLREAVAQCQACGLCQTRQQTVFGVGHEQAHWMVVGEAPGEHEDEQGEPFVGVSGQLLDRMLAALKLSRASTGPAEQRVYIANSVKCRPPRNRNPEPSELAQCEPFLQRQIALVQPKIILAMGRFAVQSLLRSTEPIGKLRGKVHRYQGVPLVVTYHPAYLLRSLGEKARAWEDLCLAADTYEALVKANAARPG